MTGYVYGCEPGGKPKAYSLDECVKVPCFTLEEFATMTLQEKYERARRVYLEAGDDDAVRRLDEEMEIGTSRFEGVPLSSFSCFKDAG